MIAKNRKEIYRLLYRFMAINFAMTLLISCLYIVFTKGISEPVSYLFVMLSMVSNSFMLYLLFALLLYLLATLIPFKKIIIPIIILFFSLFHFVNLIDVAVYRLYKFHINSMVIKLLTTSGVSDSLHFTTSIILLIIFAALAIIGLQVFIYRRYNRQKSDKKLNVKRIVLLVAVLMVFLLADKITYAVSDLYNHRSVTRLSKVFPVYQPLTIKKMMRKTFGMKIDTDLKFSYNRKASSLDYPKAELVKTKLDEYPNIVWIFIDAWRYDMLNDEVSSNLSAFARRSIVFNNHYSGGNASRFGVFSIFYSIYGYYWHQFLGERRSPVFMDELLDLGYDMRIISSTALTNPEFRSTVFAKVNDKIDDSLTGKYAATRDPDLTRTFLNFLSHRDTTKPFFSFMFYDAPHMYYSYPKEYEIYTPTIRTPNYLTTGASEAQALKNSYMNAIRFDDDQLKIILDSLESGGYLENTIVLISGDHGEEFYESGNFGHISGYSIQQTKVPLILYIPGYEPDTVNYLTSHLDVVPTMFDLLGYTSNPEIYSQGQSLFKEGGHEYVVATGWDDCAVIDSNNILVFSYETISMSSFEVRDPAYKLVADEDEYLRNNQKRIMGILKAFEYFMK